MSPNITLLFITLPLVAGGGVGGVGGGQGHCLPMPKRLGFDPWIGKISWSRAWQPTPVFLPEESRGQRSLVGYSP